MAELVMKYQQYDEYKDSGVEWLGEVPNEWKITALKRYCSVKGGHAFSSDIFSIEGEPIIRIGDIKADGSISLENCKFIPTKLAKSSHAYLVEKGQLLMAMTGATIGKAGVYTSDSPAYLNQRVGKFEINNDELNYSFLWYTLKTNGYQEYIKLTAFGGAQPNISDTGMVDYISCFPSLSEQTQIANFLDHETAQIDTLIEKQQTLIQLLKEKRQAVISHAVTKGLNPDAPMKSSGVDFLSEVPEHWKVAKLKFYTNQIVDGAHFTPTYTDKGIPFLRVTDIHNDSIDMNSIKYIPRHEHEALIKRCNPQKGDLLLSKNGTIGIPKVIDWEWEFSIFVSLCLIKFKETLTSQYAEYFFKSHEIKEQISGLVKQSTVINLHLDKIQNFWFAIPPVSEQYETVRVLNTKIEKFDGLIRKAEKAIQLMQERRTALISAAVTGKIDVREWQKTE